MQQRRARPPRSRSDPSSVRSPVCSQFAETALHCLHSLRCPPPQKQWETGNSAQSSTARQNARLSGLPRTSCCAALTQATRMLCCLVPMTSEFERFKVGFATAVALHPPAAHTLQPVPPPEGPYRSSCVRLVCPGFCLRRLLFLCGGCSTVRDGHCVSAFCLLRCRTNVLRQK